MTDQQMYSQSAIARQPDPGTSGWVGWIAFAAVLMILLGGLHIFQGIVALVKDEFFLVGPGGLALNVDFTAWGWTHLVAGTVVLLAGFGVLAGQMWARIVGVVMGVLSVIVNVAFLAAYPFWSLTMIALAVVLIMALTVHGSDIKAGR
ncbi:MAG TPA: hypothetical protein VMF51_02860 [Nocardioides sp.]|jgi:hypothetical protein|uniref:DUF7144 family membrane protein n=1 Tax=Nocardioides sp. TaxID=35761 RepID=UPI002C754C26|nr:hypothetical protein [Nocardioides sp.]HTW14039.1 hypothetical protein [Nocardioides sp.]